MTQQIGFFALLLCGTSLLCAQTASTPLSRHEIQRQLFSTPLVQSEFSVFPDEFQGERRRKKVGLAALYSLLLPGMGELYAENFGSGKFFLAAEGVLWLGYAGLEMYGNAVRDDARAFAASRAGVNPAGKDDQFWVDIGNFTDTQSYNEKKARDRAADRLYDPNAGYLWKWDSDASRATFKNDRIASENLYNNQKFVVVAVLINHVASAINAARAAISYNKSLEQGMGDLQIKAGVLGGVANPHGVLLTFSKPF